MGGSQKSTICSRALPVPLHPAAFLSFRLEAGAQVGRTGVLEPQRLACLLPFPFRCWAFPGKFLCTSEPRCPHLQSTAHKPSVFIWYKTQTLNVAWNLPGQSLLALFLGCEPLKNRGCPGLGSWLPGQTWTHTHLVMLVDGLNEPNEWIKFYKCWYFMIKKKILMGALYPDLFWVSVDRGFSGSWAPFYA